MLLEIVVDSLIELLNALGRSEKTGGEKRGGEGDRERPYRTSLLFIHHLPTHQHESIHKVMIVRNDNLTTFLGSLKC